MKVRFSTVEEFLEELRQEASAVEDQIVRLTFQYHQTRQVHFVYHMSVLAGFVVRGKLIELRQRVGEVMHNVPEHEGSANVKARAEAIARQIETAAEEMNLILRRGVFEP
jgi:hypothetical protein